MGGMPADDRRQLQPMQVTRSKTIAPVIALGYLVTVVVMWGWNPGGLAKVGVALSLPLGFIWFPDKVEVHTRKLATRTYCHIDTETPAFMVTFVGWLFLVGYFPLLAFLLGHW